MDKRLRYHTDLTLEVAVEMNNHAGTDEPGEDGTDPDVERDSAPDTEQDRWDDESPTGSDDEGKETILEMRQVAGLTAGSVMALHRGSFQFRESDKDVGFSLVVEDVDHVYVVAGSASATVDEIPVEEPTPLGSAVLNVGSACFTVRPPRPEPTTEQLVADLETARRPPKPITRPRVSRIGNMIRSRNRS